MFSVQISNSCHVDMLNYGGEHGTKLHIVLASCENADMLTNLFVLYYHVKGALKQIQMFKPVAPSSGRT